MENEKLLIAGGLLAGAYFLFGGKGKESSQTSAESEEENLAPQITEELVDDLELTEDELEDLQGDPDTVVDIDDVGDVEEYYEEETSEPYEYQGPSSISAGGGGGGGGGRGPMVDWCGTMITQAQANAYMAEMISRSGPDGHYEEKPVGSNCWKWIPRKRGNGGGNGNGNGNGQGGGPLPGPEGAPPGVSTGGSTRVQSWSGGAAPVPTYTRASDSGPQGPGINVMNWAYGSH